jgi:hypothetical protein
MTSVKKKKREENMTMRNLPRRVEYEKEEEEEFTTRGYERKNWSLVDY